jgi:hypothetical protein
MRHQYRCSWSYLEKHHTDCTPDNNIPSAIVIKSKALWGVLFEQKYSSRSVRKQRLRAVEHLDPILCLGPRWNMMINDNIDVHNGANGTTAEFVSLSPVQNLFQFKCLATGYTLSRLTKSTSLSGKIMTDSRVPCWPTQGVYKVKFPVTEAGKEIRVPTTMDLTISYSWKPPQQGTNCKESPLMNWLLRNGPKWRIGTLFFKSRTLASSWRNRFHP